MGIISWLVVGAIAGYLAGLLVKGDESYGLIGHIVLGIVGAVVGGFIAGALTGGDYITRSRAEPELVAAHSEHRASRRRRSDVTQRATPDRSRPLASCNSPLRRRQR